MSHGRSWFRAGLVLELEVVNYGLDHKKISKLKLIYAQHNNLFMAYLLVWAVSFCRRFFCPLYPRILKAFLLGIRWS